MPASRVLVASAVLLVGFGCEPLLGLNHEYSVRSEGSGGMSTASSGGTTATRLETTGGVISLELGGFTSGGFSAGGTGTVDTSSTRMATGGVAGASSAISAGGAATGGTSSARTTTGGAAIGGTSSSRTSTGGVGPGGTSSTRASTGGVGSGGTSGGGAGSGGGSNCTACSHAIALQSESATPERGSNSASGTTYSSYDDRCPGNQVLIGYAGTLRDDVHTVNGIPVLQLASLVAICGTVSVGASGAVT